jgi:antitoxin component YwqK of YwqJK toxin-antitoxin module
MTRNLATICCATLLALSTAPASSQGKVEYRKERDNKTNLVYEYRFENGKLNGITKVFYGSGELKEEMSFEQGIRTGINREYHRSGKLHYEYRFVKGKLDGETKRYDENGNLIETIVFKDGARMR